MSPAQRCLAVTARKKPEGERAPAATAAKTTSAATKPAVANVNGTPTPAGSALLNLAELFKKGGKSAKAGRADQLGKPHANVLVENSRQAVATCHGRLVEHQNHVRRQGDGIELLHPFVRQIAAE